MGKGILVMSFLLTSLHMLAFNQASAQQFNSNANSTSLQTDGRFEEFCALEAADNKCGCWVPEDGRCAPGKNRFIAYVTCFDEKDDIVGECFAPLLGNGQCSCD